MSWQLLHDAHIDPHKVSFKTHVAFKYECDAYSSAHVINIARSGDRCLGTLMVMAGTQDLCGGDVLNVTGHTVWMGPQPVLVFIPLGAVHEVTPITTGTRVVLTASVHGVRKDGFNPELNNLHFMRKEMPCD